MAAQKTAGVLAKGHWKYQILSSVHNSCGEGAFPSDLFKYQTRPKDGPAELEQPQHSPSSGPNNPGFKPGVVLAAPLSA